MKSGCCSQLEIGRIGGDDDDMLPMPQTGRVAAKMLLCHAMPMSELPPRAIAGS